MLQHRDMRLALDARRGGVIRELRRGDRHILRATQPGAGDDPMDSACFPMVPYVNRVAHGRFRFGGYSVQLQPNWSQDPHPLHGQGWRSAWEVAQVEESGATLRLEAGANDWPWPYLAQQHFQLQADGLSVELSVRNLGNTPMPAMLGLHPYFPDLRRAQLQAHLPRVWLTDRAALPLEETVTPAAWSFEKARPIEAIPLDHGFAGWDGTATLQWPDRMVTVSSPDCRFLHVYAPVGRDYFCVEPQTAAPGALTRNPTGEAAVVAPGESLAIRVKFCSGAS